MDNLIRQEFGINIDPLAGVPPEHLDEARRTVELWHGAARSDLRQLISAVRKNQIPEWKRGVLAKTLARYALEVDSRLQKTVVLAMAAVDHDFDAIAVIWGGGEP
ncbi:MAG TPA: hypothetical protein VHR72_05505 [Gemmataceae bacterium]|jgi:hypothetical protein|nr:hypothetical protein [Gemmataceae bacterium]